MSNYVIGLDFGTLSCRGVLLETETGNVIAQAVCAFEHGVVDHELPTYGKLPDQFALQVPKDYLKAMRYVIDEILQNTGMDKQKIGGLGKADGRQFLHDPLPGNLIRSHDPLCISSLQ